MDLDYTAINDPISNISRILNVNKNILYLWNVHRTTDNGQLFALLSTIGNVQWSQAYVRYDEQFGFGYARFMDEREMKRAQMLLPSMAESNGGYPIYSEVSGIGSCTRFVEAGQVLYEGFPEHWNELICYEALNQYGQIISIRKMSPSTALVHFNSEKEAKVAICETNCHFYRGPAVLLPGQEPPKRICLRIYNLPESMTSGQLRQCFGSLNDVSARVFLNANGISRREGYVHFPCPAMDTPLLFSFCYYNSTKALLGLSWLGPGYKHHRPDGDPRFDRFPPTAQPTNKKYQMFEAPPIAKPFISEIEDYEKKLNPSLVECCLGAYHLHVTNYEGLYDVHGLRALFSSFGRVLFCSTRLKGCAIVSYNSQKEAFKAIRGAKAGDPRLRVALLDSYQLHHQLDTLGDRLTGEQKNPMSGNWIYQMGRDGRVKKLPKDELAKTVDKRQRELNALMHTLVDMADPNKAYKERNATTIKELEEYFAKTGQSTADIFDALHIGDVFKSLAHRPGDHVRGQIVDKIRQLFPKSTDEQKAEMIQAMMGMCSAELMETLQDDNQFRRKTIQMTVEMKRRAI